MNMERFHLRFVQNYGMYCIPLHPEMRKRKFLIIKQGKRDDEEKSGNDPES